MAVTSVRDDPEREGGTGAPGAALCFGLDEIPAPACALDAAGALVACNPPALELLGPDARTLVGALHPDDRAALRRLLSSGQSGEAEARVPRGDGWRWVRLSLGPRRGRCPALCILTDIDELRTARQELGEARSAHRASERNLNLIIDSLPVLAWSARPNGGADFVNRRWAEYAGVDAATIVEWGFLDFYHPDDVDEMVATWMDALANRDQMELKGRIRRHDGVYRWFLFSGRKITDANGVVRWIGANVDIEDLLRAQEQLRASEQRLRLILDTIPVMSWSADVDGETDYFSRNLFDYCGLTYDEIAGDGFYRMFHPDEIPHARKVWDRVRATGLGEDVDLRLRRADGAYRWFTLRQSPLRDAQGEVVKWYGAMIDVEDRKRAEDALRASETALRESERALQLAIDTIPAMAWSAGPDGRLDFSNRKLTDYVGLPHAQLLDFGFYQIFHPDDLERLRTTWDEVVATLQEREVDGRIRGADGAYRWFTLRQNPLLDEAGRAVRWYGVIVDIEDRRRAEEEVRRSQSDLAHVSRMTTLGELAVSIAHEVNQPLTAIVTNAGSCLRPLSDAQFDLDEARLAATGIVRDGHRAGDIIAGIRALARKTPARMAPTDLGDAIREVLLVLNGELRRRGVDARFEAPSRPLQVLGDRTQLQQVLLNLVINAAEAMEDVDGGARRLTIRAAFVDEAAARVSVADVGRGVEAPEEVFEAFFSTKPDGLGMGLSICRSIIEAHGGAIDVAPNRPRGAVFSFTLPMAGREAG